VNRHTIRRLAIGIATLVVVALKFAGNANGLWVLPGYDTALHFVAGAVMVAAVREVCAPFTLFPLHFSAAFTAGALIVRWEAVQAATIYQGELTTVAYLADLVWDVSATTAGMALSIYVLKEFLNLR